MEDFFYFKLILAFAAGSTMVTLDTVAVQRLGSKIGGHTEGIPSAVATSLVFTGCTETPQLASAATNSIPFTMGSTAFSSLPI